jgi:hypothetical protein
LDADAINFVTHQGSPMPLLDAPLAALEQADECANAVCDDTPIVAHCRRCAAVLSPWVRQGFLRHGSSRWPARVIDPCP